MCGSDGVSYDNHCLLHRAACLTSSPVSPLHPGVCRERQGTESLLEELSLWNDTEQQLYHSPVALPSKCDHHHYYYHRNHFQTLALKTTVTVFENSSSVGWTSARVAGNGENITLHYSTVQYRIVKYSTVQYSTG